MATRMRSRLAASATAPTGVGAERITLAADPAPRRRVRPVLSAGHLLTLLAAIVAALATWTVLARADERVLVVVAARDLAPGQALGPDDLRAVPVAGDADLMAQTVAAADAASLTGRTPVVAIRAGQLIAPDLLRVDAERERVVSFGVDRTRALDGDVGIGDRVDVIAARDDGSVGYVLVDVAVLATARPDGGGLDEGDDVTITAAVDSAGALRLASALRAGELVVVRSTDAAPVADPEWWAPIGSAP